ncbi:MAG: hypothetical protein LBL21_05205 [Rickettsiales bacterium]|jgi:hypothetical protein|nr:hypothetical protein [Rickettsiales bacterium]
MKKLLAFLISLAPLAAFAEAESAADYAPAAEVAAEAAAEAPTDLAEDWAEHAAAPEAGAAPGYDAEYNFKSASEGGAAESKPAKKPWYRGWQIGVGVPVLPLGYNGFIGYANKKAESFWGKRFGARLDFQIPSAMKATGNLVDDGGEYDVNASGKILFVNRTFNEVATVDHVDIDGQNFDLNGASAVVSLKNQNIGGLVDFYPFGNTWFLGGLRLSGGYYTGRMDLNASVGNFPNSEMSFDIDDSGVKPDKIMARVKNGSKVAANFKWKYSGPYAGVGFDLGVLFGFKFYADVGVVFATPPKVSRAQNVKMPVLQACYTAGASCGGDWIDFDLNEKPDVSGLTADVLGQVIKGQIPSIDPAVQDQIAAALGVPTANLGSVDFGGLANDVLDYLNGGTPTAGGWLDKLTNTSGGYVSEYNSTIADAMETVRDNWNGAGGDFSGDLQNDIDKAWNDYEKGINDINKSLKDMRFMPVVKIGVMYRF